MSSTTIPTSLSPSTIPVGGTSGTGNGTLSMNLGGINLNYDLGPSISTISAQSNAFLNNSWNNDAAFVGGAIYGANNLVSGLTQPLITSAQNQMQFDNAQLPQLYTNLMNQNFQIGQGAIQAETQVAQASVAASQSAASSAGGGCYITTAVCETLGLADDCRTLTVLREFRDTYMLADSERADLVREYYDTAPGLCAKIRARSDARRYLLGLYSRYILPALLAIEHGNRQRAFQIYRRMFETVRSEVA